MSSPIAISPGGTKSIVVSSSSQSVSLAISGGPRQVRVMNDGTATVWIAFGVSGVTASASADAPIAAGATEVFTIPDLGVTIYAAAIAAGATGTIYFTPIAPGLGKL